MVVFLVRGPLCLVAVSKEGEPEGVLRDQLLLLRAQLLCILTSSFEGMLTRNPRFDARRLLGEHWRLVVTACLCQPEDLTLQHSGSPLNALRASSKERFHEQEAPAQLPGKGCRQLKETLLGN